jgi:elongation factor P--beta-lysine ligase
LSICRLKEYGDEVANGYDELQDVQDYQKCFEYEINKRLVLGKTPVAIDKDFLLKSEVIFITDNK